MRMFLTLCLASVLAGVLHRRVAGVEYLVSQNGEIKADLRALRDEFDERFSKVDDRFSKIDERLGDLKVWMLVVVGGGLLTIMARAFHWL